MAAGNSERTLVPHPILGFGDTKEQTQVVSLFAHAGQWQPPWRVVAKPRQTEILPMPADTLEERVAWRTYERQFTASHLVAYAKTPFPEQSPSPLKFTGLLKKIGETLATVLEEPPRKKNVAATDDTPYFDYRLNFGGTLRDSQATRDYTEIKTADLPGMLIAVPKWHLAIQNPENLEQLHPLFTLSRRAQARRSIAAGGNFAAPPWNMGK